MRAAITVFACCLCLQSCSVTAPAIAQVKGGETFMGTISENLSQGHFLLNSSEGNTMTGDYPHQGLFAGRRLDFTISDGRRGYFIVNAVGNARGYGLGKLSTGEKVKFMYGSNSVMMDFDPGF